MFSITKSLSQRPFVNHFSEKKGGGNGLFLLLTLNTFSALHAATCGDATFGYNVTPPNFQVQVVNLPPQFTDVKVDCNTNATALCATSLNVTDSTVVMDITTPGQYTNLNDYNFLRANRSIFPTFNNDFIITPTDAATRAFGKAVAISGDGSTLAIGSAFISPSIINPAYVNVYRRKGATWVFFQHINKPFPEASGFGGTIALSYDGSVLAVGAPNESLSGTFATVGCVALYDYNRTTNAYSLTQLIRGSALSAFGAAVALSATGQYLAFTETSQVTTNKRIIPAAYVYVRSSPCVTTCPNVGGWQLTAYLTCIENNGSVAIELFGINSSKIIDISADGSTIAFGLPNRIDLSLNPTGAVGIFKRSGSTWKQMQLITSPDPTDGDNFGASLGLSGDGKYLAVRQPVNTPAIGSVYIYEQRGATYDLNFSFSSINLSATDTTGGVAFSEDGTVLIIGGGTNPNSGSTSGSVFIALRAPDNRWSLPFSLIGTVGSNLGFAVDCSADGAFVIAGEPGTGSTTGRAHVFRPVGSFIPSDTVVTGSLCVYNRTTIDAALKVAGNVHLNGTIVTGTAGIVTACSAILSDHRMKDSITSLSAQEALDKLRELQPATFNWIHKSGSSTGFVAQDMQQVFPNFVSERPALNDEVPFIQDGNTKTIIIRAELYAYLISALERLVERNEQRNAELNKM